MTTPDDRRSPAADPLPGSSAQPDAPEYGTPSRREPLPSSELGPDERAVRREERLAEDPRDAARPRPARGADPVGGPETAPRRTAPADPMPEVPAKHGSCTAAIWIALVLGAIVLILLLIFILQNNTRASFEYFGAQFSLPLGVAMLLAAIAGALVMALVGSVRMILTALELRKLRKQVGEIRRAAQGR